MEYQVHSMSYSSDIYTDLSEAINAYENMKDNVMADGVDEDSYVELVASDDGFEDHHVLKRATIVRDDELEKHIGTPKENGCDYEWWAKWVDVQEGK